jgi:hypothetical protein
MERVDQAVARATGLVGQAVVIVHATLANALNVLADQSNEFVMARN